MNYDITLMVKGTGKDRSITPIPSQPSNLSIDTSKLELFDLDKAIVKLTADEMIQAQKGITIRDIFIARKGNTSEEPQPQSIVGTSTMSDIQSQMDKLFKN